MKALIQRVSRSEVRVNNDVVAAIGPGLLVFIGITPGDGYQTAKLLASKTANLRVFDDAEGVMNLSALDLQSDHLDAISLLVVSQFTLYADCRKGRRPSYVHAAAPDIAKPIVEHFITCLGNLGVEVQSGVFGAEMAVELVNDGPVTIMLDSDELRPTV